MNAIAEIDKSGRLVVPKKVRDALRVRAGDRFLVEEKEDGIFLRPTHPEVWLVQKDGLFVLSGGPPAAYNPVDLVNREREARIRYVSGESNEP